MRLATIRTATGTRAVRVDDDAGRGDRRRGRPRAAGAHRLGGARRGRRRVPRTRSTALDYAPLVPAPEKILCVGLNYRDHIAEMGNEPPAYPTIFAKFAPALVGAYDDIVLPSVSDEGRLGGRARRRDRQAGPARLPGAGTAAIAGYTVLNDVSVRDWQFRTSQFLQGKTFEHSTPLGPVPGHPGRAARGRLGDQHRRSTGRPAALGHGPARVRRRRSRRLPLDDRHAQPGRRHRHRHARAEWATPASPRATSPTARRW